MASDSKTPTLGKLLLLGALATAFCLSWPLGFWGDTVPISSVGPTPMVPSQTELDAPVARIDNPAVPFEASSDTETPTPQDPAPLSPSLKEQGGPFGIDCPKPSTVSPTYSLIT